jgi:hypothetical protein
MKGKLFKTTIGTLALLALLAIMASAAVAAPTMTITGAVIGYGGGGTFVWSQVIEGATISVEGYATTATTASDGTYALILPFDPLVYAGNTVTATATYYNSAHKLLGGDALQVKTFLLNSKATKFVVTVKYHSKAVKGAKVACFGKSVTTNSSGVATLSSMHMKPLTSYTVKISKSGYDTLSFSAGSSPGHTVSFTKSLTK